MIRASIRKTRLRDEKKDTEASTSSNDQNLLAVAQYYDGTRDFHKVSMAIVQSI